MKRTPLRLGALSVAGYDVQRSGVRWLHENGHVCSAGEVVAFCNVGLRTGRGLRQRNRPFAEEERDFQVAFTPRVAGRLVRAADSSQGGFLDQYEFQQPWTRGHRDRSRGVRAGRCCAGHRPRWRDHAPAHAGGPPGHRSRRGARRTADRMAQPQPRVVGRGRRIARNADLPGRVRPVGIVRGESGAFLELFAAAAGPRTSRTSRTTRSCTTPSSPPSNSRARPKRCRRSPPTSRRPSQPARSRLRRASGSPPGR